MPIKHQEIEERRDTLDIIVSDGGAVPIGRVFESGNGDPTIWSRFAGFWGVCYAHLTPPFNTIVPPTAVELLSLTGLHEIRGSKRDISVNFALNEVDWRAAGGAGVFPTAASGRAFLITRIWGAPLAITSSGFPVNSAFDPFSILLNGQLYTGVIANDAPPQYDGTEYQFKFLA